MDIRAIAFYLPQFHPIPENDRWWGEGFTEWSNVTASRPLFKGHYQPHLPANLGFYDLRLAETRAAQADLARAHGIEGFCYWHYWFSGHRLLHRPFDDVLNSGQPDFPFCLAWANETWSRRWTGEETDILIRQEYSAADDLAHARWLVAAFADPRAIRMHDRPLFLVYRPHDLPEPRRTLDAIKGEAVRAGLPEPYLLGINAHCPELDSRTLGFDGTVNFMPHLGFLPDAMVDQPTAGKQARNRALGIANPLLKVYDHADALAILFDNMAQRSYTFFPTMFVGWDNTPRRKENGVVIVNTTPEQYREGLARLVDLVQDRPADERLLFINAWNEWAEGNHLEPDRRFGKGFLAATRQALCREVREDTAETLEPAAASEIGMHQASERDELIAGLADRLLEEERRNKSLAERLETCQADLSGTTRELADTEARVKDLQESLSWRITAPLRLLGARLRRDHR